MIFDVAIRKILTVQFLKTKLAIETRGQVLLNLILLVGWVNFEFEIFRDFPGIFGVTS